jgi:hypothetical protein
MSAIVGGGAGAFAQEQRRRATPQKNLSEFVNDLKTIVQYGIDGNIAWLLHSRTPPRGLGRDRRLPKCLTALANSKTRLRHPVTSIISWEGRLKAIARTSFLRFR